LFRVARWYHRAGMQQGAASRPRWADCRLAVALVICVALLAACGDDDDAPSDATGSGTPVPTLSPSPGPEITLLPTAAVTFETADGESVDLTVEVADEPAEMSRGLMFREVLGEDDGMIFVWADDHAGGFWMRNTLVPLSIAFVLADGTIMHIEDMQPLTDDQHTPPEAYRYAIEVNQGWYAENGIEVGDTVDVSDVVSG